MIKLRQKFTNSSNSRRSPATKARRHETLYGSFRVFVTGKVCRLRTSADLQRHAPGGAVEPVATEAASAVAAGEPIPGPDRDVHLLLQPDRQLRFRLGQHEGLVNAHVLRQGRRRRYDAAIGANFRDADADGVRQRGLTPADETLGADSEAAVFPHEARGPQAAVGHLAIVPVCQPVAGAADEEALVAEPPRIAPDEL